MAFSQQLRELDGEQPRRRSPFQGLSRLWHSHASMWPAQSAFSASATTLWMLLYQSESRACTRVPPSVKLPPVWWALVRFLHIGVQRLANRLPAPRFLGD